MLVDPARIAHTHFFIKCVSARDPLHVAARMPRQIPAKRVHDFPLLKVDVHDRQYLVACFPFPVVDTNCFGTYRINRLRLQAFTQASVCTNAAGRDRGDDRAQEVYK